MLCGDGAAQQHRWWTERHNNIDGGPDQAVGARNGSLDLDQEAKDARGRQGAADGRDHSPIFTLNAEHTDRAGERSVSPDQEYQMARKPSFSFSSRGHQLRRRQKSGEPPPPRIDSSSPGPPFWINSQRRPAGFRRREGPWPRKGVAVDRSSRGSCPAVSLIWALTPWWHAMGRGWRPFMEETCGEQGDGREQARGCRITGTQRPWSRRRELGRRRTVRS